MEHVKDAYEVGDKVTIRSDLTVDQYGINCCVSTMLQYKGLTATITRVVGELFDYQYGLDVDDGFWDWTPEMFERKVG